MRCLKYLIIIIVVVEMSVNLSSKGVFHGVEMFINSPHYCNLLGIAPGFGGKTFILQVSAGYQLYVIHEI